MIQLSFGDAEYADKKNTTKRETNLAKMGSSYEEGYSTANRPGFACGRIGALIQGPGAWGESRGNSRGGRRPRRLGDPSSSA